MDRRTGLVALLVVFAACSGLLPDLAAQPRPNPSPEYRVVSWSTAELGRRVPVEAIIENVGDAAGTPICFYTWNTTGLIRWSRLPRIAPAETAELRGHANFPVPVFDYEDEDGVSCYRSVEGLPTYERELLLTDEHEGPRPGETVRVPDVAGERLFHVGAPLFSRGLRVRFGPELMQDCRAHEGCSRAWLRGLLMGAVFPEDWAPRVDVRPAPRTKVPIGTTVTLVPTRQ